MKKLQQKRLSIIIPTIGRIKELVSLLESIIRSEIDPTQVEIIVIDQNHISFLEEVRLKFESVRWENVDFKGLSKAKNFGANIAQGDFLSFPDDDCKVFSDTYSKALGILISENADIVFGRCVDSQGEDSVLKFKKTAYLLNKNNMLGGFVEATGVISKRVFEQGFFFDENMGAGCFFGAEEGFDWLYRILKSSSFKAYFEPGILFYHPQVIVQNGDFNSLNRVFKYRCGTAYLCKKHGFYFKYFRRLFLTLVASIAFLFLKPKKAKYYLTESCSLIVGWILFDKKKND